jgi:hypothetical protein
MVHTIARPKWEEVRQGLSRAALGYVCLLVLGLPGVFLVWLAHQIGPSAPLFGLGVDDTATLGWVLAGTGAVLGYLLLLAGQWRCLAYAPQSHSAKEVAFACVLCSVMAPAALGAAYFLGGPETYEVLQMGPAGLTKGTFFQGGGILQLTGVALGFFSVLLFSGFLRSLARCHGDEKRVRSIACFVWFASFLVGSTAGLFLHAGSQALLAPWAVLALGWGLSLVWHLVLILAARRGIQRALQRKKSAGAIAAARNRGQVVLRVASLVHRSEDGWQS